MSIRGRPGSWLTHALERGHLATAWSEASEIPALNLSDALALVVLMAAKGHPAFDRAAARWLARLTLERGLSVEELRFALAAVAALAHHCEDARRRLADVCARHRVVNVIGLPARDTW